MTLIKRDEITEKCTVYLSTKAWQKHFMNNGVLSFSIEIHECIVIIEGLDDCGRCKVRFELPIQSDVDVAIASCERIEKILHSK